MAYDMAPTGCVWGDLQARFEGSGHVANSVTFHGGSDSGSTGGYYVTFPLPRVHFRDSSISVVIVPAPESSQPYARVVLHLCRQPYEATRWLVACVNPMHLAPSAPEVTREREEAVLEWLDYHRGAGVEHFYVYDRTSDLAFRPILQRHIDSGVVTHVRIHNARPPKQQLHAFMPLTCIASSTGSIPHLVASSTVRG